MYKVDYIIVRHFLISGDKILEIVKQDDSYILSWTMFSEKIITEMAAWQNVSDCAGKQVKTELKQISWFAEIIVPLKQ